MFVMCFKIWCFSLKLQLLLVCSGWLKLVCCFVVGGLWLFVTSNGLFDWLIVCVWVLLFG